MERLSLYFFILLVLADSVRPEVPQFLAHRYSGVSGPPPTPQYRGVKTKTKTKTSTGGVKGGCSLKPPTPNNARLFCSAYSGCRADCLQNYQFPNGDKQIFITCQNKQWKPAGGIWQQTPSCEPICSPECQNQGICVAPNQCSCPENYSGPQCQFENKPCMIFPQLPTNSRRQCSAKSCTVTCLPQHQFPDGSSITTMSCKDGFWIPDKDNWKSLPNCEPICDPPCLNGGNCLSLGHCQCPQDYRGPQCQYKTDNCDVRKLLFNGGYKCSGDQSGLSCSLSCPEGMVFDSTPAPSYDCLYSEAKFTPTPIPQCIFAELEPEPVRKTVEPNFYNHVSNPPPNFDMNSLTVNGFPNAFPGQGWKDFYNSNTSSIYDTDAGVVTISSLNPVNNLVVIQDKVPEPGICITWQGTHYKSFDGKVFSFDSKCAHTLVRDAVDNTFSIIIQNDPKCNNDPIDCSRIIRVYFDKKEYILKRSEEGIPIFTTPKKRLPIPGQLPGIRIDMSAHHITLSLDTVGTIVRWDGQQLVQVEVQESLWNRTEGLCGNIDGDDSNDIVSKDGHKPQTISNFATSWKVEDLEVECKDLPSEEHACADDEIKGSKGHEASVFCKKLLDDPRFAPCHHVIDVSVLLDACKRDHCSCQNSDPSVCACETMNVYVRACSYKGVKNLAGWRDEKTCPMRCTGGKIYKACGPASGQPVCGASTLRDEEDTEDCVEGCYCPEGTVLNEDRCVTVDKCPCKLRTKSFPPGADIPKECNTCTCTDGKWVCTQISCGARCAAIGDPHYVTFDGKRYDFMGQCSYYLVKTPTVSIEAENVACAGAISQAMNLPYVITSGLPSCTKTVTVTNSGQTIKLKQNLDVVVNGKDISKVPYTIGNITIRSVSSIFLQVELPNGILIWWDGVTRAYIDIPANYPEKTKGLCGTFNNNQKDDFLTPEDDVEQAIIPFANKWKTSEKCNDVPDLIKSHPCSINIQNQPTAEKHCSKIKTDLFSSCHSIVDPEPYYHDCLYDMCSCEFKVSKCLCPTIAAYAEECSRLGVKVSWRETVTECGIRCPSGQKYQVCGNSCTRTCFDVATRPDCKSQCVEGCNCPEGEALDDNGECVPIGECKCHFDGLQYHAGYKEIRPDTNGPQLCTCINAFWSCRPASPEEENKFPKANDLKSLCGASENMEFTTCEPVEPITCKNMHNPDYFSASVCHPGCKCKDDYVLDTTTKKCVKPSECPCHHGGKSYKENETVQNDCNTCKCQNGKWKCTDRPCSAECNAWGDSHFKTFDGKHYDFQGQCDYVLSKGILGSDSFDISIQNVPCGTLGTSCSKSITIRVKSGENQDTLVLTKDKHLPDFSSMKHITVRKKGLFVIVEAPDLGLLINWDSGTRVYAKVDPRWKEKVKGLCGNYNDNEGDDFQTPSGGVTETSAIIFGDSWKLQSYCPETTEVTNTCEDRPDRKVWALKKCGVLKSSLFALCHSEVPVDTYLEKCIFDACACDEGGDCECLCTALAAYAQECNTRGVPIKWRSQKLCPMQCDERCSNYKPCISTCPIETCDTTLTESDLSRTCKEHTCVEGCAPKPCPPNHIYLNSSFLECVPRNVCKPVCLEIDGVTYSEGELVEEDDCHSCYCSRGEKICKGQPCQVEKCQSGWTEWINEDKPKLRKGAYSRRKSDYEPLPTSVTLNKLKGAVCSNEKMVAIECRTAATHIPANESGSDVECSLEKGLICNATDMLKYCQDFEIRVLCQCEEKVTTVVPTECDTLKPHKEHPTNCHLFYHCEPSLDGPKFVEKTCGPSMYYNPVTMVCDWPYAVEEIKPECKVPTTTTPAGVKGEAGMLGQLGEPPKPKVQPLVTVSPEVLVSNIVPSESPVIKGEIAPIEAEVPPECPRGMKKVDCAIQCDRLCLHYDRTVKSKGFCNHTEKCETGCVTSDKKLTCPDGMFWVNEDTCVNLEDCLCQSNDGKPVKPGTLYRESDCRVCQCINNYYSCDVSECEEEGREDVDRDGKLQTFEGASSTLLPIQIGGPVGVGGIKRGRGKKKTKETNAEPEFDYLSEGLPPLFSTVTPPEKCEEGHFIDLMQGDQALPDVTFNATSVLSEGFKPEYAKFNNKVGGSWAPQYSNNLQYLEIDLGQQEPVYGIKVKGSPMYDEYVTSYKVSYTPDDSGTYLPVVNKERLPQLFRGSIDANTPVQQIFDTPFEAQIVRVHPQTWHTGIALRVELIGCGELLTTTPTYEFITKAPPLQCDDPMGLDDQMMSDQQISVSSELDRNHTKSSLRLSDEEAWQPLTNSPTEFVQVDFLEPRNITGVETKGGPDGWVTAYNFKYSQDDKAWNPVLDKKTKNEQVFLGNFDSNTSQINHFDIPINARYVKLIPTKWDDNIQIRVEILGCFEPYPTLPELTTITPSECNYCPGVEVESLELNACRCDEDKWWDGGKCIAKTECPCLVGHISYAVGTSYKKEDCSECLCKIGGVSHCAPKQCDPCEKGLKSTVTTTCQCTCQPCPDGTTLCPTSSVCINTTLWCNGIQDCPDDEVGCTTPATTTTEATTTTPRTTTAVAARKVKKCPDIDCPPGFKKDIKKQTKGRLYQSSMFPNYGTTGRKKETSDLAIKTVKSTKNFLKTQPRPEKKLLKSGFRKNCTEYVCVSSKPAPKYLTSKRECPPASCPPGFFPDFQKEDYASKICPEFICIPAPQPDAVCNVTGRTFNTFDNTEYKYDICDHILARDLTTGDWEIALRKSCEKNCWRDLVIHHHNHLFVLHPNLTAEYDGFSYTVEQTKKIGSNSKAFMIARMGNVLLFVSNRYGFWVIWDKEGNVKLGVTRKSEVDGLCGFFNGNPEDDKTKPDGSLARTTAEFGDSWAYGDQPRNCEPQACPLHVQNEAYQICQVKQQALEPCNTVVNKDAFITRCIETTCECLLTAADNRTAVEECRCHALEDYVGECLMREPSTDISDWRTQLDCPVSCEAPLVYHDCYQRKCEPTCESLSDPEAACPKVPNVCFPGCYCPSGTVKKEDTCISPSTCRDCECNVLPHLQYITYDDNNFTLNANCVYVMSRDVLQDSDDHKFQVLITNAPCKNNQKKTCVGKVTILYQGRKIHILNDAFKNNLKFVLDGERIDNLKEITWAKVVRTASKHFKIYLTEIQVDVSVYYPSLGVSVKAPSQKYGGKLEGLCGNCDTNPRDDFRVPTGEIITDPDEFALSWLYEKLPGQSKEICRNKPRDCPPLPKETDPCTLILDYKTFGQCLRLLDPTLFFDWCRKDTCGNHPELACDAIEAYARDCASSGFCTNWRTNICPSKQCAADKIYNPCGTRCPKTCESIKKKEKSCSTAPEEGCFCPEGQVLRNETCVVETDCEVCDEQGHRPGDIWKKDKCTTCSCEGTSLKCETEVCSSGNQICEQGYTEVKLPSKDDECCDKFACLPEPTSGPTCETPQTISCSEEQIMKLATKPNGCQRFICECKPIDECEPMDEAILPPLEDGYVRTIDDAGCCPKVKTICKNELCPKPKPCEPYHTLKNETSGKCCPLYSCEPPKDKCIYENEHISADEGGERARTEMEKQKVLKNANETWQDGPCRQCKCQRTSIGNYQPSCTQTDCSAIELSQDYLDYDLVPEFIYDQCCPNVKRVGCKYNGKTYNVSEKWTTEGDYCTIYECANSTTGVQKETKVTKCDTNCDLGSEYVTPTPESKKCCGYCKPVACVVNGTIYKVGENRTSSDFCTNYFCLDLNGSMQIQSVKVSCPALPKDYIDNFEFEVIPVKDECCAKHNPVACKVGDKVYQVNETWPSPDGDKCKKITCVHNQNGEMSKQESVESCKTDCSKGWEYNESNETCCGQCVQVACVVDDFLKVPGENWTSPDGCTLFTCEQYGDQFLVTSQQESCPSVDDCPQENIYLKGCCRHCNVTSAAQKQCSPEALSLNKTLGLIKVEREDHGNCMNKKPIDSFTECIGSCESSTYFDLIKGSHESKCSCCQATKYNSLEVELECEDGYTFKKKVSVPSDCGCGRGQCGPASQPTKTKTRKLPVKA